ncbi:arylesterase [Nitratireductor sp. CAU 1489]|uniref:Arylesterase n=1 Tax=Nitratireductor arenosus TaxID=2682096 RepID=A0A844QEE9_9HYPH|nr:arylesterase [Nitratireductor arenosus]MVA96458.1 arylesterase [Nitratireductor arenosus]
MGFKGILRAFTFGGLAVLVQLGVAAASTTIVGLGDSLMAGYQLAPGESFPERLEVALRKKGHDVAVTNAGVSGDTTSGGLARLDWSVPDDTDLVVLELGANDMLRGLPPEITEKNLDTMIARLKGRGVEVVLAGMLAAPNLGPDFAAAFNAIFPRLAEKHDIALIPFFMEGVAANGGLLLADGMHPNAEGVDRMVEIALPVVEDELGALQSAPGGLD